MDGAFVVDLGEDEAPVFPLPGVLTDVVEECGSLNRKSRSPSTVKDEAVAKPLTS
jgi:hypothetical protein